VLELGVHNLQVILMKALAVVLAIPFYLLSAHENNGRGTKAIAFANAFVALADNPWALSYNPAGLAQILTSEISTFYVPQQFGIPELKTIALSGACNVHPGTVGALVEQFGFELYRTTDIALGCGILVDTGISVGASFEVERVAIERYGVSHSTTFNVGFLGRPLHDLSIGFCFTNVTAARIGEIRERLPQHVMIGVCYAPFKEFCLITEMEKDVQFPLVMKVGLEHRFFEFLHLRCGVANNPDKFSAGVAVRYSTFEFGYAGYSHPDLGWSHQIEVSLRWGS
jgi:hypothetical protein